MFSFHSSYRHFHHYLIDSYARLQTAVKKLRQQYPDSLLLDGGDQYQGTLWFYKYGGNVTRHFMNLVRYDAMVSLVISLCLVGPVVKASASRAEDPGFNSRLRRGDFSG